MATEKRMIDPDKLSKATIEYCGSCFSLDELEMCGEIYVDAVEVVHGRLEWITEDVYRCTNCGATNHVKEVMGLPDWNYCPNCGAKMDGVSDG